jgi:ubiquinone/menaquinone biosynthesis C-methylase UbiE
MTHFWADRASLAAFVGRGCGKALDLGCGEGRISRELTACRYEVTAVNPVEKLVKAAVRAQSAWSYAVATAAHLPFQDAQFDLVVAYNVLMDLNDVPTALKEIRRVMPPSGQLFISAVRPFVDHGHFANKEMNSPYALGGTYFGKRRFEGVEEHHGLRTHFPVWSQPLEAHCIALEDFRTRECAASGILTR